jgi:nucleoside-diphosphate-sugar epimerase
MKKLLSNKRTKEILGEKEFTSLEEGLKETIKYYQEEAI